MGNESFFIGAVFSIILILCMGVAAADTSVEGGITWLIDNQDADGSWEKLYWSTGEAIIALQNQVYVNASNEIELGKSWFLNNSKGNTYFLSRNILIFNGNKSTLLSYQNPDGGWGYSRYYNSSLIDTSHALEMIKSDAGTVYLSSLLNDDGSFKIDGTPNYLYTAMASQALGRNSFSIVNDTVTLNEDAFKAGYRSYYSMLSNNPSISENPAIAYTLVSLIYNDYNPDFQEFLVTKLQGNQNLDGSWTFSGQGNGSVFPTAISLIALEESKSMVPVEINTLSIKKEDGDALVPQESISAGDLLEVSAQISNPNGFDYDLIISGKVVKDGKIVKTLSPVLMSLDYGSSNIYNASLSTDNLLEGINTLLVEARDLDGRVLNASRVDINVLETKRVRIEKLEAIPDDLNIKSITILHTDVTNIGNVDLDYLSISVNITTSNNTLVWTNTINSSLAVGERKDIEVGGMYTSNLVYGTYLIEGQVFDSEIAVDGGTAFSTLTIGPRIGVKRHIFPKKANPGEIDAQVNVTLEGKTGKPPADIVILIDNTNKSWFYEDMGNISNDISTTELEEVKTAVTSLIRSFKYGDRIAIITASNQTTILENLTYDRAAVSDAVFDITEESPELHLGVTINESVDLLLDSGRDANNWYIFTIVRSPSFDDPYGSLEWAAQNGIPVYMTIYSTEVEK